MLNPWAPDQLQLAKAGLVGVTFSIHPFMISEWHTKIVQLSIQNYVINILI